MIQRKPDEIVADKLQELICNYEENKQSAILEHLTALHELRDEKLYHDLLPAIWNVKQGRPDDDFQQIIWDMQTFEETE